MAAETLHENCCIIVFTDARFWHRVRVSGYVSRVLG